MVSFFEDTASRIACNYLNGVEVSGSHDETSLIWSDCAVANLSLSFDLNSYTFINAPGVRGNAVGDYSGVVTLLDNDGFYTDLEIDSMVWTGEDISIEDIAVTRSNKKALMTLSSLTDLGYSKSWCLSK